MTDLETSSDPSDLAVELDRIAELLTTTNGNYFAVLRDLLRTSDRAVGDVLETLYPDANYANQRQRLLRLIGAINTAACAVEATVRVVTVGAKSVGVEQRVALARQPGEAVEAGDALAESRGLTDLGPRASVVPVAPDSLGVRIAFWAHRDDQVRAERLWVLLERRFASCLPGRTMVARRVEALAGEQPATITAELLAWADVVVLGVGVVLPDAPVEVDRVIPVGLTTRPNSCDLSWLESRSVFAFDKPFSQCRSTAAQEKFADAVVDHLVERLDRDLRQPREVVERGRVRDLQKMEAAGTTPLVRQSTAAWSEGGVDVPDTAADLESWARDPNDPYALAALLGEYGMGKTVIAQQLVQRLRDRPGVEAHYFDLRDLTGSGAWVDVPNIEAMLSTCVASGWTYGGLAISPERARETVRQILQRSHVAPTLIVVDGLDETLVHLSPDMARGFINQIMRLGPQGGDKIVGTETKLLLTCRSHYFQSLNEQFGAFSDEWRSTTRSVDYKARVLLPLTGDQIVSFLAGVFANGAAPGSDVHADALIRAERLVTGTHDLLDLAGRPFLLGAIADQAGRLEQQRVAGHPVNASTIYNGLVEQWLDRDQGKHEIRREHKPLLLEYVAAQLWRTSTQRVDVVTLGRWLWLGLDAADLSRQYNPRATGTLVSDLHTATFLVRRDETSGADDVSNAVSTFQFAHSSILEYFIARHLVRSLETDSRDGWALPPPTDETLVFFGEMLSVHPDREQLIRRLESWRVPFHAEASLVLLRYAALAGRNNYPAPVLAGIDLRDADLRSFRLAGTPDSPLVLSQAGLDGARLDDTTIEYVDLTGANLTGASLCRAQLHQTTLESAAMVGVVAKGAFFHQCPGVPDIVGAVTVPSSRGLPRPMPLGHLAGPAAPGIVHALVFVDNGATLASAGGDGTISLWDPSTGQPRHTLVGHSGWVNALAASDTSLASGGDDGTVRLWDPSTGQPRHTLVGHTGWVNALAYAPGGCELASAAEDGTVRLWDVTTGEQHHVLIGHRGGVNALAYAPDGNALASAGDDGSICLWTRKGIQDRVLPDGHAQNAIALAYSPDGLTLASADSNGTIRLWDSTNAHLRHTLRGHAKGVNALTYTPDGTTLASADDDGTVRLWDAATGGHRHTLTGHIGWVNTVAAAPDGQILASGGRDGAIRLWDPLTGLQLHSFTGNTSWVNSVAATPGGDTLASAGRDGTIRIWDRTTGRPRGAIKSNTAALNVLAYTPDGTTLVTANFDGTIHLRDATSGAPRHILVGHTDRVSGLACAADGRSLASAGRDGSIRIWNPATGHLLHTLVGHTGGVNAVAYSIDGRSLASAGRDGSIRTWNPTTGQLLHTLVGHTDWVNAIAYAPSGNWLATAGIDGSIRVWDSHTGVGSDSSGGHAGGVNALTYNPDGLTLASAGRDGTIQLWDSTDGQLVQSSRTFIGHTEGVNALIYTPDGRTLTSASTDGTIRLWDARSCEPQMILVPGIVPDEAATWRPGTQELLHAGPEAWRWLRVRVADSAGRFVTLDPYEWRYETAGGLPMP